MTGNKSVQATLNDASFYRISPDCSQSEFLSAAKVYARRVAEEYDLHVRVSDLSWEVSTRAKRRAGAVKRVGGKPAAISLTWEYFQQKGWKEVAATIRHELIHVHLINQYDDHSHGERFRRLADRLNTHVNCDRFCDPKWWVICEDCGSRVPRYRKSKLVKNPDKFQCGNCSGTFVIKKSTPSSD